MISEPELAKLSPLDRVVSYETVLIKHQHLNDALRRIELCHTLRGVTDEPSCLLFFGDTGVGKSTIMNTHAARFPRQRVSGITKVPVLTHVIPQAPTTKSLSEGLLKALGDPMWHRGTQTVLTERLCDLIRLCGVEIIMLDEFQHFAGVMHRTTAVADWLKILIEKTDLPMVLFGMPECQEVLDHPRNRQLKRRFSAQVSLGAYDWTMKRERLEFRGILQALDAELPVLDLVGLSSDDLAVRFYWGCGGLIGYVMKVIRKAVHIVAFANQPRLDRAVLAQAFEQEMGYGVLCRENPFLDSFNIKRIPRRPLDSDGEDPPELPAIIRREKPTVSSAPQARGGSGSEERA